MVLTRVVVGQLKRFPDCEILSSSGLTWQISPDLSFPTELIHNQPCNAWVTHFATPWEFVGKTNTEKYISTGKTKRKNIPQLFWSWLSDKTDKRFLVNLMSSLPTMKNYTQTKGDSASNLTVTENLFLDHDSFGLTFVD